MSEYAYCSDCEQFHPVGEWCWDRITVGQLRVGDQLVRDGPGNPRGTIEQIDRLHPIPARRLHFADGHHEEKPTNDLLRVWRGRNPQQTLEDR